MTAHHQRPLEEILQACAARPMRVTPRGEARHCWEAQLIGYQRMPDEQLLRWEPVRLTTPIEVILGQAGARAECDACGEEIINGNEVMRGDGVLCRACAAAVYYRHVDVSARESAASRQTIYLLLQI